MHLQCLYLLETLCCLSNILSLDSSSHFLSLICRKSVIFLRVQVRREARGLCQQESRSHGILGVLMLQAHAVLLACLCFFGLTSFPPLSSSFPGASL